MRISRAPAPGALPERWVTGTAWIQRIVSPSPALMANLRFTPGSRTVWHRQPAARTLVVTGGTGLVQRRGGPVETLRAGDSIEADPGEWHWYGATATDHATWLAVDNAPDVGPAEPGDPV